MQFKEWLNKIEQLFNEDFKSQREKFIQQGNEDSIIDRYLADFKNIKEKKYKQINDPIQGLEHIKNRIDIDAYKTFHELEVLVDYVKGQVDVVGKTSYKNIKVDAEPIFEDNKIIVYYADSPQACISYKGSIPYGWCVARSDSSNMYYTYRFKEHEPAFYFVKNKEKTNQEFKFLNLLRNAATLSFKDKYHFFVIQVVKGANPNNKEQKQYIVTSALNNGDVKMSWNEIVKIEPDLAGKENLFTSKPLEAKEKELYSRFINGISDEEFAKLPYDEKDMYLNIYVRLDKPLSDSQFAGLPYDLKNKYIGFGVGLSPEQIKIIDSKLYKRYEDVTNKLIEKTIGSDDFKINATQIDILIKNISKHNMNELSNKNVTTLFHYATNKDEMAKLIFQTKKELTGDNVRQLLYYATNKDKMAEILGLDNINKLSDEDVYSLLQYAKNPDEMAKFILQYKKELTDRNIENLLHYATNKDEMAKFILQTKKELTGDNVVHLLYYAKNKDKIAKILGSDNINKLSDEDVGNLFNFGNYEIEEILQQYGRI